MSEDKRKKLPHPCQPVADDGTGVTRFKENAIVRWLVDEHDRLSVLRHEHCLNRIAAMDFSREDRVQFAQLIGYSLIDPDSHAINVRKKITSDDGVFHYGFINGVPFIEFGEKRLEFDVEEAAAIAALWIGGSSDPSHIETLMAYRQDLMLVRDGLQEALGIIKEKNDQIRKLNWMLNARRS